MFNLLMVRLGQFAAMWPTSRHLKQAPFFMSFSCSASVSLSKCKGIAVGTVMVTGLGVWYGVLGVDLGFPWGVGTRTGVVKGVAVLEFGVPRFRFPAGV